MELALRNVANHAQTAAMEMGHYDMMDDGRSADQLYNDDDLMADTCRDFLHDELVSNKLDPMDKAVWNEAVDLLTSKYLPHLKGMNASMKRD